MFTTLMRCYLCGISCAIGVGPIFILTLRAVMLFGFWYGVIIALGAALGDSVLFFLGIKGLLSLLNESRFFLALFYLCGGIALIAMGFYFFKKKYELLPERGRLEAHARSLFYKSFVLTLFSPFSIALFALLGMKFLPQSVNSSLFGAVINSLAFGSGTFTGLVTLSAGIRLVGANVSKKYLNFFSKITAIGFILAGIYFVFDFLKTLF